MGVWDYGLLEVAEALRRVLKSRGYEAKEPEGKYLGVLSEFRRRWMGEKKDLVGVEGWEELWVCVAGRPMVMVWNRLLLLLWGKEGWGGCRLCSSSLLTFSSLSSSWSPLSQSTPRLSGKEDHTAIDTVSISRGDHQHQAICCKRIGVSSTQNFVLFIDIVNNGLYLHSIMYEYRISVSIYNVSEERVC